MVRPQIALCIALASLTLTACDTIAIQRYHVAADNNEALRAAKLSGVGLAKFSSSAPAEVTCRLAGPLAPPDGLSHVQYIEKAFSDELKMAGAYAADAPRVTLTGHINQLELSTSGNNESLKGNWQIGIDLTSSNGARMSVQERYEFESAFAGAVACKNAAEAYIGAVQNTIGKAIRDPKFPSLVR